MTKLTKSQQLEQFRSLNNEFIDAAKANHSYAYVAGYFNSTIVEMFELLSKKDQAYMMLSMEQAIERQQKIAVELGEQKRFALAD